jgi:hypothetical protein
VRVHDEHHQQARQDAALQERSAKDADRYLGQKGTTLETDRGFVHRAFVLTEVFKDVMAEAQTDAITINSCMGTIMPMSETTACLPLSLLNDGGYLAFCESDFVARNEDFTRFTKDVSMQIAACDPTYIKEENEWVKDNDNKDLLTMRLNLLQIKIGVLKMPFTDPDKRIYYQPPGITFFDLFSNQNKFCFRFGLVFIKQQVILESNWPDIEFLSSASNQNIN